MNKKPPDISQSGSQETEIKNAVTNPETKGEALDLIARNFTENVELMKTLIRHPNLKPQSLLFLYNNAPKELKTELENLKKEKLSEKKDLVVSKGLKPAGKKTRESGSSNSPLEGIVEGDAGNTFQRIQEMSVAEKVQFALKGGRDARSLLIKDSNRQVSSAVLASPKITEDEVLLIAQSRNVSDELLRIIAKNKDWMKSYSIMYSIATNPKTPLGLAMPLLHNLTIRDLNMLGKSRNVPEAIRSMASRLALAKQKSS